MLIVTNIAGVTEALTDYQRDSFERKLVVNGERSISFTVLSTERNVDAFPLVTEESIIECDSDEYRIKSLEEYTIGQTAVKRVTALHRFFDLIDEYRYTELTDGSKTINEILSFIFTGTSWSFSVIDSFPSVTFEKFGKDNCLALFKHALESFGAEYELSGNSVIIREQIGATSTMQFRYNHNVKTLNRQVSTDSLSTYIKGYGKKNDDDTYVVSGEYTSPMAAIYGVRHAEPIYDDRITNIDTLNAHMQAALVDTPEVSITLDIAALGQSPGLGDTVPTIYEPLGVDLDLRVLEIVDYPEAALAPKFTLANLRKTYVDVTFEYAKRLMDEIYDRESKTIRYDVLDEATKRATEALNNSLTELEYPPNMGILARDPDNPDRFVVFRSSGIGVTTDGGVTFPNAITADGINTELLTAGQIKTNNVQIVGEDGLFYWDGNALQAIDVADPNKFVKLNEDGLYIAKGALTIERPDGYKVVDNGVMMHGFNIQGAEPPFQTAGVTKTGSWYAGATTNRYENVQAYTFKHESRYLVARLAMYTDGGATGTMAFDTDTETLATVTENRPNTVEGQGWIKDVTMDLGTPTGALKTVYLRMFSSTASYNSYGRILYILQEG